MSAQIGAAPARLGIFECQLAGGGSANSEHIRDGRFSGHCSRARASRSPAISVQRERQLSVAVWLAPTRVPAGRLQALGVRFGDKQLLARLERRPASRRNQGGRDSLQNRSDTYATSQRGLVPAVSPAATAALGVGRLRAPAAPTSLSSSVPRVPLGTRWASAGRRALLSRVGTECQGELQSRSPGRQSKSPIAAKPGSCSPLNVSARTAATANRRRKLVSRPVEN
jgi:hypothetical protein